MPQVLGLGDGRLGVGGEVRRDLDADKAVGAARRVVDGDAGELFVDHQLAQFIESGVCGDRYNIGPRRHHFSNDFVAELHHALNELAVIFLDEAFFGAGRDQGFDVFGGRGLFFGLGGIVGELDQRLEEIEQRHARSGEQGQGAEEWSERQQPAG